ncbi:MAG: hypothetical protein AAF417_11625 [Pseudomonadota bacterium]
MPSVNSALPTMTTMVHEDVNEAIDRLLGPSVWIKQEHRAAIEAEFSDETMEIVNELLHFSCWPSEIWIKASSLTAAAKQVEPRIREAYPYLSDRSIELLLGYACFSWK